jgi:hypothetical protein
MNSVSGKKNFIFKLRRLSKAVLCFLLFVSLSSFQGSTQFNESTIKALFIYNFMKYVDWSVEKNPAHFVVGFYGKSDVKKDLLQICQSKKVKSKEIEVIDVDESSNYEKCDILFISKHETSRLKKIAAQLVGKEVLIVTEENGMALKGSSINIIEQDGKFRFEINEEAAQHAHLKIANQLLSLAILVKSSAN